MLTDTELLRESRKLSLISCMPDSAYNLETRLRIFVVWRSIASVTAAGEGGNGTVEGIGKLFRLGVFTIEVILSAIDVSWSELEKTTLVEDFKKTRIILLTSRQLHQRSLISSEKLSSRVLLT